MPASRNYVFTLFFEDNEDFCADELAVHEAHQLSLHFQNPLFKFVIVNVERCPSTQRIHWQGYVELSDVSRYTAIKKAAPILDSAHFERRMGTAQEAIDYCSKADTRVEGCDAPFTYGKHEGQGHRSDLDSISELVKSGKSVRDIAEIAPGTFIRYHAGIKALISALKTAPEPDVPINLYPWQQSIMSRLATEPDDRTIIWVTDTQGGKGKSRLTTHLVKDHGALCPTGNLRDMTYAFCMNPTRIVCFDITRAAADSSSHLYSQAEMLKNGRVFSAKYESHQSTFKPPHVIFFSNQTWDTTKFSLDRVIEYDLDNKRVIKGGNVIEQLE